MTLLFSISFTHAKKASTSGFTDCCLLSRISCGYLPLQKLSVLKITAILSVASLAICCTGDNAAPFFLFSRFLHIFVYSEPYSSSRIRLIIPAIRISQMFQFASNLVKLGKTVGNQDSLKVLIILFGMITVACFLVFIHNDLWIRAKLTGQMHPHVASYY